MQRPPEDAKEFMRRERAQRLFPLPRVPVKIELSSAVKISIAQFVHGIHLVNSDFDKFVEKIKKKEDDMEPAKPIAVDKKKPKGRKHNVKSSADEKKDHFLDLVASHDVVVVGGATGSGKSVFLPLGVLEQSQANNVPVNVVSFQPRKVACSGLANYMAKIRNEAVGDIVGYAIAEKKQLGKHLNVRPHAAGVHLASSCNGLSAFSHVIIDEVHEQGESYDELLVLCVRSLLSNNVKKPKLILMSATLDTLRPRLTEYFSRYNLSSAYFDAGGSPYGVKTLRASSLAVLMSSKLASIKDSELANEMTELRDRLIPRSSRMPREHTGFGARFTSKYYPGFDVNTEDHLQEVESRFTEHQIISELDLHHFNRASADLQDGELLVFLFELVDYLVDSTHIQGSVLVFMPRVRDCDNARERYQGRKKTKNTVRVFSLHSKQPSDVQREIVSPAQEGELRVIFSTAIAESSLTIPNVAFVIDCGRGVVSEYQALYRHEHTIVEWSSHATLEQRKGRAGRVKDGYYIKLYSEESVQGAKDLPSPAILSKPMPDVILSLCHHHRSPFNPFVDIDHLLNSPPIMNVYEGLERLVDVGALEFHQGLYSFTSFGRLAVRFGCNVEHAKQVLLSLLFKSSRTVLAYVTSQYSNFMERSTSTTEQCDARAEQLKSNYADFAAMFRTLICYEEHVGGRNAIGLLFKTTYGFGEADMEAFLNNRQAIADSFSSALSENLGDNFLSAKLFTEKSHKWAHIIYPIAMAMNGFATIAAAVDPTSIHKISDYLTNVNGGYKIDTSSVVARKLKKEWETNVNEREEIWNKMKYILYDRIRSSAAGANLTGIAVVSPTLALLAGGPLKKSQTFDIDKETLWQIMCNGREDRIVTEAVGQVDLTAHESTHLAIKVFRHVVAYYFEEFIRQGDVRYHGFEKFLAEVFSVVAADENLSAFGANFEIKGNATQRDIVLHKQAPRGLPLNVDPSIQRVTSVPRPRRPRGFLLHNRIGQQ